MKLFESRKLLICTKHQKEEVIAPLFEKELRVNCRVSSDLDTDQFGTFSGEIKREETAIESLRKKCLLGMEKEGYDLGFASEGSFGAHPYIPFVYANQELTIIIDKKNDLEVFGNYITSDTNFSGQKILSLKSAFDFAKKVGFPTHGLILKNSEFANNQIEKGIICNEELKNLVNTKLGIVESLWIETDMRACFNPTRMIAIKKSAEDLIKNLLSFCPKCEFPGYSIVASHSGLQCKACGSPTKSIVRNEYRCKKCSHQSFEHFPYGREYEDPTYCDFCNP